MNYRIKIFTEHIGSASKSGYIVEEKFKAWIDSNPNIKIIDFKYQMMEQNGYQITNSICVLYEESNI